MYPHYITGDIARLICRCVGSFNELFGNLQVGFRSYYSATQQCNWTIGNAGISQAVAFVLLRELYLSYSKLVHYF